MKPFADLKPGKMRPIAVRYDSTHLLHEIAENSHCSVSDIVRDALDEYLGMRDKIRVRKRYVVIRLTRHQTLALKDVLPKMEQYGAEWPNYVTKRQLRRAEEAYEIIVEAARGVHAAQTREKAANEKAEADDDES